MRNYFGVLITICSIVIIGSEIVNTFDLCKCMSGLEDDDRPVSSCDWAEHGFTPCINGVRFMYSDEGRTDIKDYIRCFCNDKTFDSSVIGRFNAFKRTLECILSKRCFTFIVNCMKMMILLVTFSFTPTIFNKIHQFFIASTHYSPDGFTLIINYVQLFIVVLSFIDLEEVFLLLFDFSSKGLILVRTTSFSVPFFKKPTVARGEKKMKDQTESLMETKSVSDHGFIW